MFRVKKSNLIFESKDTILNDLNYTRIVRPGHRKIYFMYYLLKEEEEQKTSADEI